jgi:hypothetical protein
MQHVADTLFFLWPSNNHEFFNTGPLSSTHSTNDTKYSTISLNSHTSNNLEKYDPIKPNSHTSNNLNMTPLQETKREQILDSI